MLGTETLVILCIYINIKSIQNLMKPDDKGIKLKNLWDFPCRALSGELKPLTVRAQAGISWHDSWASV